MGFDKPQCFVDTSGDLSEQVGRALVARLNRLVDVAANIGAKCGKRIRESRNMGATVDDIERVFLKHRLLGGNARRAFRGTAERRDSFGDRVGMLASGRCNLIEQSVQRDKARSFNIPMRLLGLG